MCWAAIVSQLFPPRDNLWIYGRQELASALEIDDNFCSPNQSCMLDLSGFFIYEIMRHIKLFSGWRTCDIRTSVFSFPSVLSAWLFLGTVYFVMHKAIDADRCSVTTDLILYILLRKGVYLVLHAISQTMSHPFMFGSVGIPAECRLTL